MSRHPQYDPEFVTSLASAKKDFLEVLLHRFELHHDGDGNRLVVTFDENTPAIGSSEGRRYVRGAIADFANKAAVHRAALDRFYGAEQDTFSYADPAFPFRYVSGGVLPIITMGERDYYCLIYRECFPVGWNLANGASDSFEELLNPSLTINRELREELIIFDPTQKRRYAFETDSDTSFDTGEYDDALALWGKLSSANGWPVFDGFDEVPSRVDWIEGPDTLEVAADGRTNVTGGCFLNINPEDFGIEVDRVARLTLDDTAILCDGELTGRRLIDSVIGLFEVKKFNRSIVEGSREFVPDRYFYGGAAHPSPGLAVLNTIVRGDFVPRMQSYIPTWDRSEWDDSPFKYDLCPVTRALTARTAPLTL